MGSLSEGVRDQGGKVIGIIHEKFCIDGEEDTETKTMIVSHGPDLTERKQLLYDNGDCIIVLPGGVGTFDELWESISAKSLNMKGLAPKPICIANLDGFYDGSILQLKRAFDDQLLYLPLEKYVHVASTVKEALHWSIKAYNASLGAPLEDISSSRKSLKVANDEKHQLSKQNVAAINQLTADDKIPTSNSGPSLPVEKPRIVDNRHSNQYSSTILVPLTALAVGLILGYSFAKSNK
jgi:predicted Rossmann-fold nucleotide-binding protein